jgi:hypothetical protein
MLRANRHTLLLVLMVASTAVNASEYVLGTTFPIEERDVKEEINQSRIPSRQQVEQAGKDAYKEILGSTLGMGRVESGTAKTWKVVPTYSLPFEVVDKKGEVIYPKGFTFNPLDYAPIKKRYLVINDSPEQIQYAQEIYSGEMILVDGNPRLVEFAPAYKLPKQITDRTGITRVPVSITQESNYLRMTEHEIPTTISTAAE